MARAIGYGHSQLERRTAPTIFTYGYSNYLERHPLFCFSSAALQPYEPLLAVQNKSRSESTVPFASFVFSLREDFPMSS